MGIAVYVLFKAKLYGDVPRFESIHTSFQGAVAASSISDVDRWKQVPHSASWVTWDGVWTIREAEVQD